MSKEERHARFLERQRAITAADQASRGYVEVKRARRKRRARADHHDRVADRIDGFDRDDLGESHD